jgi:hypothetical protein
MKALKKVLSIFSKPVQQVGMEIPVIKLRTVYPPGGKRMSLNGKEEWYGEQVIKH